jgi:two-component system, OmpR family, phosphate regulon response regulator OmpR
MTLDAMAHSTPPTTPLNAALPFASPLPASIHLPTLPDDAQHILVVDDDTRLRDLLSRFLTEQGYRVTSASRTQEADLYQNILQFDALVLDVMMPSESGFEYAKRLRAYSAVPILMLTARAHIEDRIIGLEIGVDDYLSKPFEPRELVLRLANILKRAPVATEFAPEVVSEDGLRFGDFHFRIERGELRKGDERIRLSEREVQMLTLLARRAGEHVPREDLAGEGAAHLNERTIDVQMNRLRRKIEDNPANPLYLQTVRGIGYRLVVD